MGVFDLLAVVDLFWDFWEDFPAKWTWWGRVCGEDVEGGLGGFGLLGGLGG